MSPPRPRKTFSAALALGLGLGAPSLAPAQQTNPGNTNISTGSGAGTSPGVSPGSSPSSTRIGNSGLSGPTPSLGPQDRRGAGPPGAGQGSGIDPTTGLPAAIDNQPRTVFTQAEVNRIDAQMLESMRSLTNPADRAMGMDHVAQAKLSSQATGDRRLEDAHAAVAEGGAAALRVEDRVTRDIRLRLLVRTAMLLADEQTREAMTDITDPSIPRDPRPWTARRRFDWLLKAETERHDAAILASKITNPTLRGEMIFRVVDSTAQGSQTISHEAQLADGKRFDLKGMTAMIGRMADRSLVFAANDADLIKKPIWRDRAMLSIAIAAATSDQFERGIEICRTIPQPEFRADAMMRLGEAQARRNLPAATETYRAAAAAVASIPIEDPRSTLASVLIDSLISVGRFEDARACVSFYPDDVRRLVALGTIAGSQGERRLADSALAWIDSEAPPAMRDTLKLRVAEGVLRSYEKNRSNAAAGTEPMR
jgi:hypothetical protein